MDMAASQAEWQARAACLTADPELFFPLSAIGPGADRGAGAKAICASCGARTACREHARAPGQVQGVWGGPPEEERRILRNRRPRAAAGRSGPGGGLHLLGGPLAR